MSKALRVLTMPGMGDNHWVILKIQALARSKGCDRIEVGIWNADNKPRSKGYIELLPFVDSVEYFEQPWEYEPKKWRAAVHEDGQDLQPGFDDWDYVFSFNGSLRNGRDIQTEILADLECDFQYPVNEPPTIAAWADEFKRTHGPYILYYFNDLLMYAQNWLNHFPLQSIVKTIIDMQRNSAGKFKAILTGVDWDQPFNQEIKKAIGPVDWLVDMTTATDVPQLFGLIRRASAFVGWCAGNTIMSTHLGTPTVMLWSDYFESRNFATCWADPAKLHETYWPLFVEDIEPSHVVGAIYGAMSKHEHAVL